MAFRFSFAQSFSFLGGFILDQLSLDFSKASNSQYVIGTMSIGVGVN